MNRDQHPKLSTIEVESLRLRAYIGFIDWEKKKLQDVVISYSFQYDASRAAKSDEVKDAVDYKKITKEIIQMVDSQHFHLIEALAEKIYDFISSFSPDIQNVEIKVEKPNALRFTDNVLVKISGKDRYNIALIALGSNIDPENNFEKALDKLQNLGTIVQRSQFIYTDALKFENQPKFLNGAILFYTKENLTTLKLHLKQIEARLGRVRTENKNAPREIDLDILTFNHFKIDNEMDELPFLKDFVKELQPEIEL